MGGPSAGYVCTTENTVIILIKVSSVTETYAYYFGDGNPNIPWCQGIELEKGIWYYITNDGTDESMTLLSKEKYNGPSPIREKDYSDIYSETYLQRVINSFNNDNISNGSDFWWDLTRVEERQINGNNGMIAMIDNGCNAGSIIVARYESEKYIAIFSPYTGNMYIYYFGEGEYESDGIKLTKNRTWYYITNEGTNEYTGSSPINKEDFETEEIISESYLQRVINSF